MSTFRGVMAEFPDVRVDYFRRNASVRAPLAGFLSHIHSDHLAGLDTLKAPFVYCSPATREILLRLERYPHRLNFELGILESRKQTYRHLDKLLKPIPLETPTSIELEPGNIINVTLFDANHCPGAVMFLFQSQRSAVLYTGDIRSEPWFVNKLTRNPFLIEFTTGMKTLDCIYLDTSNTENISFDSKADGLKELVSKVLKYPQNTVFHLRAWTYGYEDVWLALSTALKSKIHVEKYKKGIYESLRGISNDKTALSGPFIAYEGPVLTGYQCGNTPHEGCLTTNPDVRIHSCERGMHCPRVNDETVWITPIVTRHNGVEVAEIGVGGGGGDLVGGPELEVESENSLQLLLDRFVDGDADIREDIRCKLLAILQSNDMATSLNDLGLLELDKDQNEMPLRIFFELVSKSNIHKPETKIVNSNDEGQALPKHLRFPYSRHSSFPELRDLVSIFRPKDVFPCTVDEPNWHEGISIQARFGHLCSGTNFRHDFEMRGLKAQTVVRQSQQTHTTDDSEDNQSDPGDALLSSGAPIDVSYTDPHSKYTDDRMDCYAGNHAKAPDGTLINLLKNPLLPDLGTPSRQATPSRDIVASTPGSESQSLRRKLILGDIAGDRVKRARHQIDGTDSSPPAKSGEHMPATAGNLKGVNSAMGAISATPNDSGPPSTCDSSVSSNNYANSSPDNSHNEHNHYLSGYPGDNTIPENTYWDFIDHVLRCCECGHETWAWFPTGSCTYCDRKSDIDQVAFCEVLEPETGPRPQFVYACEADHLCSPEGHGIGTSHYMDNQSSAYDSQDEERDFQEDYEIDSFIDDASEYNESQEEDTSSDSSDGETNWKLKYQELEASYTELHENATALAQSFDRLQDQHDEILDDLGINDNTDDDMDESGVLLVNPTAPDLVVTELVLSQAQEQSQTSDISSERIRDRAAAFQEAERGWHSISLVSTRDNHTEEEIEL